MITVEKENTMTEYCVPYSITVSSLVNTFRKAGMTAILSIVMVKPCIIAKSNP